MAITAGDKGSTASATSVATAGTLNVSAGDVLLAVVSVDNGPTTVTSFGDNAANTWTANAGNPFSVTGQNVYFYRAIASGAKTGLVATANFAAAAPASISVVQVTGRSATPFLAQVSFTESVGTTSHTSGATGTITVGCDVVAMFADSMFFDGGQATTYTGTGSFTSLAAAAVTTGGSTPTSGAIYNQNVGATTSQTATWTNTNHSDIAASVIYALAPGGNQSMTASVGTFSLSGQADAFGINFLSAVGTYTLAGQAATLAQGQGSQTILAATGAFNVNGGTSLSGLSLPLASGIYVFTGQNANLIGPASSSGAHLFALLGVGN